jgi:type IV secretion system protein TrbB
MVRLENVEKTSLEIALGESILNAMKDKTVTDIACNANGKVFAKKGCLGYQFLANFDPAMAKKVVTIMYSYSSVNYMDSFTVEGRIPFNGARFLGTRPPITEEHTFVIRMPIDTVPTLSQYTDGGIISLAQKNSIEDALSTKKNILIVGGTGSGKTTLMNAMLNFLTSTQTKERFLIIQDTPEIVIHAENKACLLTNAHYSIDDALKTALRADPDRIIVGEVRGKEAYQLIKSWNTGHPGGIATIHANGCDEAIDKLEQLVSESSKLNSRQTIEQTIDVIIHMVHTPTGIQVKEIKHLR